MAYTCSEANFLLQTSAETNKTDVWVWWQGREQGKVRNWGILGCLLNIAEIVTNILIAQVNKKYMQVFLEQFQFFTILFK